LNFLGFIVNWFPHALLSFCETLTNSGVAAIIVSSTPLFTTAVAYFIHKQERLQFRQLIGLLIGVFGLIFIELSPLIQGSFGGGHYWYTIIIGNLLLMFVPFCYAIGGVFTAKYLGNLDPVAAAFGQITCGAIQAILVALLIDFKFQLEGARYLPYFEDIYHARLSSWGGVLFQGIAGVYFAFSIYFFLIQRIGATILATANMLFPIYGILEGALILNQWANEKMVL